MVFVMAAVIAITLYMELPRVAFDVQRQKEQLLMERGQQYQLAIRRYMQRGLKQGVNQVVGPPWPARIEDLENTNGRRFLRKRYIDPMTGKDEWRIIHINNGVLTDSINNKPKTQQDEGMRQGGITEFASMGGAAAGPSATNPSQRRRASDNAGSSGGGAAGDPNAPVTMGDSGSVAALPGGSPGVQPVPVQLPVPPIGGGALSAGGTVGQGNAFGFPVPPGVSTGQPSFPGQLGGAVNSNNPGGSPYVIPPNPNGNPPFFPQPGAVAGGQLTPQQLIGNLLTQPRPGGMVPAANPTGNNTIGGGIAGVASKLDDDSIMVCADHTNYQEWEFIFDPSKWRAPADPRKTIVGTPAGSSPSTSSNSSNFGPGMAPPPQPGMGVPGGMGGPGGMSPGPAGGQSPNPAGGLQGGSQNATCGMEARPGIQ